MDFRSTLNLPKTDFSMRAGLAKKEPEHLKRWADQNLYTKMRAQVKGKKQYTLHDGPPYANGDIHIGHALNKILKDFIVKSKTMQGFDSRYIPGWDCHGLPIEHQLLKKIKKNKHTVDGLEFRKKAHDYAMRFVDVQKEQFQRLGIFGDWDKPYLTLNADYEYAIVTSLMRLHEKGFIYRGLKPVNWCIENETALAEAEVEYDDITSPSIYVKFKVENPQTLFPADDKPISLLIWTTTPWTLVANVAVAVHQGFDYAVLESADERIIVEASLVAKVLSFDETKQKAFKKVATFKGDALLDVTYQHPLELRSGSPVVTADYVTKEDGTGLVHTAPGHGQDDFETGRKNDLDVIMVVNDRGVYNDDAKRFAGLHIHKANDVIIEELQQSGRLWHATTLVHSYPHSWRSKKPVIFRATKQWFLKIDHDGLRDQLLQAIENDVQWFPASAEERIRTMVGHRPDWCLSRQRFWGVPIPALVPQGQDHEPRLYPEVMEKFAEMVRTEGTDAWFARPVRDFLPDGFVCPETGAKEFEKAYDILDVWFDSGVSHQAVVKGMLGHDTPTDLYLEGSDQHRGWFQSSLIPSMAMDGKPPFKEVLTHGFVVDGQGRKMSKSLGNVMAPQDIINNSGADILRLWIASSSYNEDIRVSKEVLDRQVDAYRKIRNTFRYLLGNLYDFDPNTQVVEYQNLNQLDQWAMHQLYQVQDQIIVAYNTFQFAKVYKAIYTFFNEQLSNFYLDILKDRLYISAAHSVERKSAQTALFHILNHMVRLVAPILVFTADEIFAMMPKTAAVNQIESVHLLEWLDCPTVWNNDQTERRFDMLIKMRPFVMKALEEQRRADLIGSSLEAKIVFQTSSQSDFEYLTSFEGSLPDMFVVSQAEVLQLDAVEDGLSVFCPNTRVLIKKADGQKCSRSWKYSLDVGQDPDFPTLSKESASIVKECQYGTTKTLGSKET